MSHKSKHNIMINQTSKIYFFFLLSLSFVFLCLQVQQLTSKLVNVEKKYISANSKIAQIQNNVLNLDENNRQLQSNTQQIHASIHRNNTVRQKHTDILLRVIVLTMNRAQSLNRLLHSLFDAEYYHDKIALDIWIDLPPFETKINVETRQIVTDFSWPYGPKTLHFRDNNVGLRRQWLESWNYSVSGGLKPDLKECALIVEDDIIVSPLFWKWLKAAHAQYRNHSRIAGFSLQRLDLCAGKCPSHVTHDLPDTANFLYPLVGSWGFSPRLEHWINFTKWTMQYLPDEIREKPYVEDTVPTTWYKSFEKTGKCPGKNCMWTQLHHYYTSFSPDKYTLYYKAAGKKALSHNYREKGLHFGKGVEVPVGNTLIKADDILRIQFPTTPIVLNYNGEVTGSIKGDLEFLHFQHAECQQSLKWLPVMFFNSEFHMKSFLDALFPFLKQFPDYQELETIDIIKEKSEVLFLGMDLTRFRKHILIKDSRPNILWNHRWEYDKNPQYFFRVLKRVKNESNDFGLVILGENFSKSPKVFEESKKEFVNQIVHWGYVDSFEEYAKWLWKSHIIPVTSNQEFFGVSVMEAMYCDVWPIVPNRLTYPELIPERFHNNSIYNTEEELFKKILWSINNCNDLAQYNIASIPERFDWRSMSKEYDEKLEATL